MDDKTKEAAAEEAFRHLLLDLETTTRRQNQLLMGFMALVVLWSLAAVFVFLKLDAMEFATNLIA